MFVVKNQNNNAYDISVKYKIKKKEHHLVAWNLLVTFPECQTMFNTSKIHIFS